MKLAPFRTFCITLLGCALLSGCVAAAIPALQLASWGASGASVATAYNMTSDTKELGATFSVPTFPDDLKASLNGTKHLLVLPTGGAEVEAAVVLESGGYTVEIVSEFGNVGQQPPSARTAALQEACLKHTGDSAIAVQLVSAESASGAGILVGKTKEKLEFAVDSFNCQTKILSSFTGVQLFSVPFGHKDVDEQKQAGRVGALRLIELANGTAES